MNDLTKYATIFDGIKPFSGEVPLGYKVDFLGTLTDAKFLEMWGVDPKTTGGKVETTKAPTIADGEIWFEAVNWVEAAKEARGRFVMVTLGANYGAQAVGAYRALQALNPMPYKLIAVEPEPDNIEWTKRHMRDNGIDPADQWIVGTAIGDNNDPVLFPVGSPGSGTQNSFAVNQYKARERYARQFRFFWYGGRARRVLRNLLLNNSTGVKRDLAPNTGYNFMAEIKMMSAVTLVDILSPFDVVDYVESDIQQSEIIVFPPFIDFLKKKVRRIHIGTHGTETHATLLELFKKGGWEIVFDFAPNKTHHSTLGDFSTNDGVLTVRNPTL